ncbi:MAG: GntR family transcriptional regulator [Lachnospiraceae bacterium]|nr:GntR family transcriptional regulator [Lachnospiraceae bacterium]
MNIIISNSSMEPIYEQITGQIKSMILEGKLQENTVLPSVRSLSKNLKISALTVKKAYDCLEQEGFIITVHGKGSFVAPNNKNLLLEERRKEVEALLEQAISSGMHCGMTEAEIRELFELLMEEII